MAQDSLFDFPSASKKKGDVPLAELLRPERLEDVVGLADLIAPGQFLRNAIESDRIPSMIFWGPPGSGKTTLARIIAKTTKSRFIPLSAASSGIKEIKPLLEEARANHQRGVRTIVFIDEIHRFNRAQQDAFLPYVESGDITLIGATTENPSFEVNSALLSRCKVVVLPELEREQILTILQRATEHEAVTQRKIELSSEALDFIAATSAGDARQALNSLQLIVETSPPEESPVDVDGVKKVLQRRSLLYDKTGEQHYNIISALHKSIRNGDADASVYWLARMLEGGEDPLYIARRLVRAAAEDIGLADPDALKLAIAAKDAVHFIGLPEGAIVLAELAVYLAQAPKSNAIYVGYEQARHEVREGDNPPVPLHIRNAPTNLMKQLGYGKGYQYAHDFDEQAAPMECLPESLVGRRFYEPNDVGREAEIKARLEALRKARRRKDSK
ncbi:MAG TPA: replication-associated recombination protein A [Thermoanaerobaculia bacterium]